ncbi:MAG: hypothetical protein WD294_15585 [Phycisphaeraceae bacterium]
MENEHPNDGIVLDRYPAKLHPGDIDALIDVTAGPINKRCPKLARWMAGWLHAEVDRRKVNELASEPMEPTLPAFNASTWTNGELADATHITFAVLAAMEDRPNTYDILANIHSIILAWAAIRLRETSGA